MINLWRLAYVAGVSVPKQVALGLGFDLTLHLDTRFHALVAFTGETSFMGGHFLMSEVPPYVAGVLVLKEVAMGQGVRTAAAISNAKLLRPQPGDSWIVAPASAGASP